MMKIAIAGMGGVGGFYGSKLARAFANSTEAEIYFFARGEHLNKIIEQGLELRTDDEISLAKPFYASANPNDFGRLDLIIFCCKTYSLEEIARQFASTMHPRTLLLPLLNGVDSVEVLNQLYPEIKCLYGCVYIYSRIAAPGIISQKGSVNSLFFGHPDLPAEELKPIEDLFRSAGIDANLHPDILQKTWAKFCFIAPVATLTSAENKTVGALLENVESRTALTKLIAEVVALAQAKGISLPSSIHSDTLAVAERLPYETNSSMQSDFAAGKETELETLTGYVVREAERFNIPVPVFAELYKKLKAR